MNFKIAVIEFKNNKETFDLYKYSDLSSHITTIIDKFVEIQDMEVEDIADLLNVCYKNDENIKKYFNTQRIYFEFIHCFENKNYCYYFVYPYSVSETKPENNNILASFLSRNKESVYCKSLILKYNIKAENYEDITKEDIKTILRDKFEFKGLFIDFDNNQIGECLFYSEAVSDYNNGPALYLGDDVKVYLIEKSFCQLKIITSDKKNNFINLPENNNETEIKDIKMIKEYLQGKEIKDLNNCVCVFYYFYNGHKQIYNLSKNQFINLFNFLINHKDLKIEEDEIFIFSIIE